MANTADYTDPLAPDPEPRGWAPYPHNPNDPTQPAAYDPGDNPVRPDYAALARVQERATKDEQAKRDSWAKETADREKASKATASGSMATA